MSRFGNLRFLWLSLLIIVLDQWTKHAIVANFAYGERLELLPFFSLTYVHNLGAAFSFLHDAGGWQRWFFTGIALVISVGIVVWLKKMPTAERFGAVALALVLGGAIGNVYDRIVHGYVIDFIAVMIGSYPFPAFNVADSAICVGAVMLVLESFIKSPDADPKVSVSKS